MPARSVIMVTVNCRRRRAVLMSWPSFLMARFRVDGMIASIFDMIK